MVIIKTSARFEAAHRQLGDDSKCGYLHGHNWVVEFVVGGDVDNYLGYLINFTALKDIVKPVDHVVMLHRDDPLVGILTHEHQRVYIMDLNPTCENIATLIVQQITIAVRPNIEFVSVTVWENEDSMATDSWMRE
jgi:6-pyruvoyltetrahydropterin/6-carboxytetrahydropterin synthase